MLFSVQRQWYILSALADGLLIGMWLADLLVMSRYFKEALKQYLCRFTSAIKLTSAV